MRWPSWSRARPGWWRARSASQREPKGMQQNTEARDSAGLKNMQQLIQLRWIAVVGQIVTIAIVHFGFGIRLPLDHMGAALAFLVAFNLVSLLRWRRRREVADSE